MNAVNGATAWLVKEFNDSISSLGQRSTLRMLIRCATVGYVNGSVNDIKLLVSCINFPSLLNVEYSFGNTPDKAIDFIADHSFSVLLNKAGLKTFDSSVRLGIKRTTYAAIIAVGLNALGFTALAVTTAKVTIIAKTILLHALAQETLERLGFNKPQETTEEKDVGYLSSFEKIVIESTVFGWNPLAFGVIAMANRLARDSGLTNEDSYFVSRAPDGTPQKDCLRNEVAQAVKLAFNYTAVTTVVLGAFHLAGKLVMRDPLARVAIAVEYLALAYWDFSIVQKEAEIAQFQTEAQNSEIQAEADELQAQHAQFQAQNAEIQAGFAQIQAEFHTQNTEIQAQIAEIQAQNAQIQVKNAQIQAQVAQIQVQNAQIQAQVAQIQVQNAQIQAQVAQMQAAARTRCRTISPD